MPTIAKALTYGDKPMPDWEYTAITPIKKEPTILTPAVCHGKPGPMRSILKIAIA
jgi:hypothetical protein